MSRLIPRMKVPNLDLPLAGGGSWRLNALNAMLFVQPNFDDLLKAIELVSKNNYPPRSQI